MLADGEANSSQDLAADAGKGVPLENLAVGLAHEIRNSLTSIKLAVQTAAQGSEVGRLTDRQLWVIQEEIARIDHTVQGLLDFARPPDLRPACQDLRDTLRRAIRAALHRPTCHRVEVFEEFPVVPLIIRADHDRLGQAFLNVLLYGTDARMPVQITIDEGDGTEVTCRVLFSQPGRMVPQHLVDQLFEPCAVGKQRRVGLMLAVSRSIIEQHGGSLTAASVPGQGLAFRAVLPLDSATQSICLS
jgi:signal transduction histidine kinase